MSCICAVCLKFVKKNQRNLKCTICKMYVHKCCSDATGKEFRKKTHFKYWHCSKCNDLIALPFNHIVDDREFLLEIYRTFCDRMLKEFKNYDHFIFNPLENKNVLGDVYNPECNSNSEYFTDEELDDISKNISSVHLNMLNVNIRSTYKNYDSLKDFLHGSKIDFNIIGLSETWLREKPLEYFHLDGYKLEFINRKQDSRGGGVCLFVKDEMKYFVRKDLLQIKHPENTETLFIEIEREKSKNIIVGIVYRSPDQDVHEFNQFTENLLSKVSKSENKLIYMMGDFNINLLNSDTHTSTSDFIDVLNSYSLYPSITRPTRITSKSATLIDNIFKNSHSKHIAGIILTDISDHLPTFISTNLSVYQNINEY